MKYYLSNALGFLIQLVPCAMMIFLPFPQQVCRFSRKRILLGTVIGSTVLAALFPLLQFLFPDVQNLGNFVMLTAAVLLLICHILFLRERLIKKILVYFIVLFYAVSQFWLVNATRIVIPSEYFDVFGSYSTVDTLLYAASMAVMLPVMMIYVIRPVGEFIREVETREMRREFLTAIISTTFFALTLMYVDNQELLLLYYHIIVLLELLLIWEQILIYWLLFRESLRRRRDSERQRALEIQKLQYEKISREMENARRLRHDLRHHLNAIGALNAQGRTEEITAYLKQYGAEVDGLSSLKFSGDPVVDGVLEYYLTRAEELSVRVKYTVALKGAGGVDAVDMTVLLGNLLENALEALQKLPEKERTLSIDLWTSHGRILLSLQNRCVEKSDSGEFAVWTAFADRTGENDRGVGLCSVDAIAEKYDGSALFGRKSGIFTARVLLNPGCAQ